MKKFKHPLIVLVVATLAVVLYMHLLSTNLSKEEFRFTVIMTMLALTSFQLHCLVKKGEK